MLENLFGHNLQLYSDVFCYRNLFLNAIVWYTLMNIAILIPKSWHGMNL